MNLPTNYIHDISKGYGWLIFPFKKIWVFYSKTHGVCTTDKKYGFHNCTKTGIK